MVVIRIHILQQRRRGIHIVEDDIHFAIVEEIAKSCAARAEITVAKPVVATGGTGSNVPCPELRNRSGRSRQLVPHSCLLAAG